MTNPTSIEKVIDEKARNHYKTLYGVDYLEIPGMAEEMRSVKQTMAEIASLAHSEAIRKVEEVVHTVFDSLAEEARVGEGWCFDGTAMQNRIRKSASDILTSINQLK